MDPLGLLSGDAQAFREKVWASRVHLHHADPAELAGYLSLDDVDLLLTGSGLRTPAVRVVQDGTLLPASAYTRDATLAGKPMTGLLDARKVLALFDGGATVVLQGLHRYWPPLADLVRGLEIALGHPCQANAYLTPPGAQGFDRHSDTHDVFVFQSHGEKQWTVVEGGEGADVSGGSGGSGDLEREVLLVPGLSMYLPTGTPHSARSQEHTSLHVTIGINRLTWRQVLRGLVDTALADEQYAAPLPAGYLDDPSLLAGPLAGMLSSLQEALGDLDADEVAAVRVDRFLTHRLPSLRGGLTDLTRLPALSDDTVVARRPSAVCVLRPADPGNDPADTRLRVLLGDRELLMPGRLSEAMAFVRDHDSFRVSDLAPWLDEQSRLVVVRRLVREGLLRPHA